MGGLFGAISKRDCVLDIFFGVDYHSHLGTRRGGMAIYDAAEGKFPPEEIGEILRRGDRTAAGPTVPAGGLYMSQLWYDDGKAVFHVG